jgi:hypothetical protein
MKQEDKDLLLKDLCARLPYGVKMNHIADNEHSPQKLTGINEDYIILHGSGYSYVPVEHYKPYLFPLSSITEEQKKELKVRCDWCDDEKDVQSILVLYHKHFVMKSDVINWCYKNHLDVNNLIPNGLAIDCTNLNIY